MSVLRWIVRFASILTLAGALAAQDTAPTEKKPEKKRRIISVTSSSGDVTRSNGQSQSGVQIIRHVDKHRAAIAEAKKALREVEGRLVMAETNEEITALVAARQGLETAIENLERQRTRKIVVQSSDTGMSEVNLEALENALESLTAQEQALYATRRDIKGEIEAARQELEQALGDVELEMGLDGNIRNIRLRSLRAAQDSLLDYETMSDADIKRAEKELALQRARLEQAIKAREGRRP